MWGRKGMKKVVEKSAGKLAKTINKEDFLAQLKGAWRKHVKKHTPIEEELAAAMSRIESSPFKGAFKTVGIVEDDVRQILEEIREEKLDPVKHDTAQVGRNEPCPCGSGKKYKRCCGV